MLQCNRLLCCILLCAHELCLLALVTRLCIQRWAFPAVRCIIERACRLCFGPDQSKSRRASMPKVSGTFLSDASVIQLAEISCYLKSLPHFQLHFEPFFFIIAGQDGLQSVLRLTTDTCLALKHSSLQKLMCCNATGVAIQTFHCQL